MVVQPGEAQVLEGQRAQRSQRLIDALLAGRNSLQQGAQGFFVHGPLA